MSADDKYDCVACHGLGLLQPIDDLAQWLNDNTPNNVHFDTVGGFDPMVQQQDIIARLSGAFAGRRKLIFIGHSKGAMLGFYVPGYVICELVITIDPTCWGSNIDTVQWTFASSRNAGRWQANPNVSRWANFHQPGAPGGGVLINPNGAREDHEIPGVDHMSIVNDPFVRHRIHELVMLTVSE